MEVNSCFYECDVFHRRLRPKQHEFLYRVFYFYLDLAELDVVARKLKIFGVNRPNIYSLRDRDHLQYGPGERPIADNVREFLERAGCPLEKGGSIRMLCFPRMLGYTFNPITIYFCFRADGTPLMFMPSAEMHPMPDRELGAIIAYVRTLPRVDNALPPATPGPVMRLIDVLGLFPLCPAHDIEHGTRPPEIPAGRNAEMGHFIALGCTGCHGHQLSGGPIPGAPPDQTGLPPNLTFHATGLAGWTEEQFRTAMREGRRPDGTELNPEFMPWQSTYRYLTDDEVGALYDYLQTVPHRPEGER